MARDPTGRFAVYNGTDSDDLNDWHRKLYVRDTQTGQEVRLGDDNGDAFSPVVTDTYVLWKFNGCDSCPSSQVKSGVYTYDLATGQNIWIQALGQKADLKADGRWIGYIKPTVFPQPAGDQIQSLAPGPANCLGDLYVYDLVTKQEQQVSSEVPWSCGVARDFYAISDNRVVWTQLDLSLPSYWALRFRNLNTRQTRVLYTPNVMEAPDRISFSGDYILWSIQYGFDLKQNVLFEISLNVPGWENIGSNSTFDTIVRDDRIYWPKFVDNQTYFFTAPLVRVTNPSSGVTNSYPGVTNPYPGP